MAKPFDATLNTLIDAHAADWAAFLAVRTGVPPGPATVIDTDISSTLQADRLFRVDGPTPAVLHLELESSGRLGIPRELLRYNIAAWGVTWRRPSISSGSDCVPMVFPIMWSGDCWVRLSCCAGCVISRLR